MSVWTNWDPLEEVIVGDCYAPGDLDWFVETELQESFNTILVETKKDLDNLAQLLQTLVLGSTSRRSSSIVPGQPVHFILVFDIIFFKIETVITL